MKRELVYKDFSYQVVGILFEVHNELGRHCKEKQYGDSIEQKLKEKGIYYFREQRLESSFSGETSGRNIIDFNLDNKIILEIKCTRVLGRDDYYQMQRYLKASGMKLGLLVNFRDKYLKARRILNSRISN